LARSSQLLPPPAARPAGSSRARAASARTAPCCWSSGPAPLRHL